MSKKCSLRRPFDKQYGKRAQALLNSGSQSLYHIHWPLPSQLSWKKSPFLTCKILGLLVNTLAADEKYPVLFLIKTVQRYQFRYNYLKNKNPFCKLFAALKSKLNFKHFEKKMTLIAFVFPKWRTPKILLDKCLKSPVSEDPSTCNMADVPKHC